MLETTAKKENKLRYFFKMYTFMRPYIALFIPGLILYSSQSIVTSLISSIFSGRLTAAILSGDKTGILYAVLFFAGANVAFFLILVPGLIWYVKFAVLATKEMKARLFRRFVKTSLEASMATHSGEGIAAINTDADTAARVFDSPVAAVISCVLSIVFSALVVFLVDWRLGAAATGIGIFAFLIQYKFAKPLGEISKEKLAANADSVKKMSGILSGAVAIRAFNMQNKMLVDFDRENGRLRVLSFKEAFISAWQSLFTTVQGWLTITGVFMLGGYLVATRSLEFPSLMMVPTMCSSLAYGMSQIGASWAALQGPIAAAKRVFGILGDDAGRSDKEKERESAAFEGENYRIEINNLTFRYQSADSDALSGVSLEIGENEMVALVGESGSGKSTLMRALIGMYERDGFDMRVGDFRFSSAKMLSWRARFSYVDQSCKLFDMSIAENIGLGRKGSTPEEIKKAAAGAYAADFIEALPGGYDAPCGEKGASLSGGQKQRIAIARALVRKSPVLVFDEATSALDAESEKQVIEAINSLRKSHTILITTHNLNNIVNADRIIVMDGGRVAETGRHTELMEKKGVYAGLFAKCASK